MTSTSMSDHDAPGHEPDDHGHAQQGLGPMDAAAWGAGALGIVLGLVVAACLAISTGLIGR